MKKYISIIIVLLVLIASRNFAQQKKAQIIVGPNVQVNNDGNFDHFEYMFAADPTDHNNLIGGTMTLMASTIYVSNNGGNNWYHIDLPAFGTGGDPETAFSNDGTAYFMTYGYYKSEKAEGGLAPCLNFYTSKDKGRTWEKSSSEGLSKLKSSYDHDQLAIDETKGKFAGRIYIGVLGDDNRGKFPNSKYPNQYQLYLLKSDDEGKTFTDPQVVVRGDEGMGLNVTNLLVSSNGTLFFTYDEWFNNHALPGYFNGMNFYLVSSKDGGNSFTSARKIGKNFNPPLDNTGNYTNLMGAHYQSAIDNKSNRYKDRIYCVYDSWQDGRVGVYLTYSKDEGKSWSKPRLVDPNVPAGTDQFLPAVTVNVKGVVGIRWRDSRGNAARQGCNEYFTASLDGGETFLPSIRVSSETSSYKKELISPRWSRSLSRDSLYIDFTSRVSDDISVGGHYMQFTADAKGVFHDFWPDSRDGRTSQIYTSAINVIEPGANAMQEKREFEHKYGKEANKKAIETNNKVLGPIAKYIYLQMDLATYDTTTNVFSVPVRIKNISDKPIFGPIKLQISGIDTLWDKHIIPSVLNSDNKKESVGAEFTYTSKEKNVLLPGEETETVIWKLNINIEKKIHPNQYVEWLCDKIAGIHVVGYVGDQE